MILRPPAPPAINYTVCLPEWDWSVGFSDPRCTNPDTRFGASMVFGDFNGDGQTDLAVGAPGCGSPLEPDFGVVSVCFGSAAPLGCGAPSGDDCMTVFELPGHDAGTGHAFGTALAAYPMHPDDPNGGHDWLVVSAPGAGSTGMEGQNGRIQGFDLSGPAAPGQPGGVSRWWSLDGALPVEAAGDSLGYGHALAVGNLYALTTAEEPITSALPELVVGAPFADREGHTDVGAVEVLLPLFEGPDPVTDPPPVEVPSPFWSQARTALLPRPLEGEFVDDTRFGFALAIGRFDESGERAYRDLAIGAPGGVPTTSQAAAGLVEIVEGGLLEGTAGWPVAPVDAGALGAAQVAQSVPPVFIEWDISAHSVPEPGDEFGYALFAADLVRTTLSELGGQWMDELVIGIPGEDLAVDVLSGPAIADAGAVCVHVFSDGPLVGIAAPTPGRYGDIAPGFVDASTRCVGLLGTTQTDMVPLGCSSLPSTNCPGSGLKPGARLGSSVAASRLSPWDPDVQVAVGAPGRPSSNPPVAEGRVHVFHFVSVYGDQVELADGTSGSRVRYDQLEPWGGGTSPGTSLGAAMALAPDPCGEVPDLLVSGSNSGSEIGRTRMKPNSRLDADMSGRYERNMSGGESATVWLALLVDPANPGAQFGEGYAFTASVTNYSPALTFEFEAFSACTPVPWNWLALPGGMPVWQVSTDDCVEGLAAEQTFYSPDGFDWGGFAWPAHNRLDDWSGPQNLVDLDLEDLTRLPELITAAGGTVGVEFEFVSPVRYVSLCPDLTLAAGGQDLSEALLLGGDKVNGCPEAEIEFTRGPEGELDCNRRWDLQ